MENVIPKQVKKHQTGLSYILRNLPIKERNKLQERKIPEINNNSISFPAEKALKNNELFLFWHHVSQQINKHNWRYFNSFRFSFLNCTNLTDKGFQKVKFSKFKYLKYLKEFQVEIIKANALTNKGIKPLLINICRNPHGLKKFSLLLSECNKFDSREINMIMSQICTKRSPFQELSLGFYYLEIKDEALKRLGENITNKLRGLKKFDLTFFHCLLLKDTALDLFSPSKHTKLQNLKDISLSFQMCFAIGNEGLRALAKDLILRFPNLQHEGLKTLSSELKDNYSCLNELKLDFDGCSEISNQGLKEISNAFQDYLQNVRLAFGSSTNIGDDGVCKFSESMRDDLVYLKSFELILFGSLITHIGIQNLSLNISSKFSQLENLKLDFSASSHLKHHEALEALGSNLIKLQNLRKLILSFSLCEEINDEGLKKLGSNLLKIQSIESLHLNFFECLSVTNEGTKLFQDATLSTNLPNLTQLFLNFSRCNDISDKGVEMLISSLILAFPNLEKLILGISTYENISGKSLKVMGKLLKEGLRKLRKFELDVDYCHKITNEDKENLCNELKLGGIFCPIENSQ